MIPAGKLYTHSVYIFVWHIESGCARCIDVMQYLTYSNVKRAVDENMDTYAAISVSGKKDRGLQSVAKYSEALPELTALMRSAGKLIRFRL